MRHGIVERSERLAEIIAWAESRKQYLEADSRFRDKPADVFINAPLALIQVQMKAEHRALCAVLKMARGDDAGHAPQRSEGSNA